jgi:hypothetical protein
MATSSTSESPRAIRSRRTSPQEEPLSPAEISRICRLSLPVAADGDVRRLGARHTALADLLIAAVENEIRERLLGARKSREAIVEAISLIEEA